MSAQYIGSATWADQEGICTMAVASHHGTVGSMLTPEKPAKEYIAFSDLPLSNSLMNIAMSTI